MVTKKLLRVLRRSGSEFLRESIWNDLGKAGKFVAQSTFLCVKNQTKPAHIPGWVLWGLCLGSLVPRVGIVGNKHKMKRNLINLLRTCIKAAGTSLRICLAFVNSTINHSQKLGLQMDGDWRSLSL